MLAVAEKNLTVREVLLWAEDYLTQHDVTDAKIEAEYLLAHVLECKRAKLFLNHTTPLSHHALQEFTTFIERRTKREPSQYIIGEQEFWGLEFKVTRDVLIPRPETEILVEEAVKTVRSQESEVRSQNTKIHYSEPRTPDSKLILDLCTGSGCIAISIAKEIPDCHIYAVDVSEKALDVARENAERHGVANGMIFLHGDLFEPLLPSPLPLEGGEDKGEGERSHRTLATQFSIIVSNPPYVSRDILEGLQPEIRDYEPHTALYGGEDGLDFYRRIIAESPAHLSQGGHLILEIGYGQAEEIKKLIEQSNAFADISITKDFAGIDRVIKAQRKG